MDTAPKLSLRDNVRVRSKYNTASASVILQPLISVDYTEYAPGLEISKQAAAFY